MKIPKRAKKVFEGVVYDVYHWEQERFDGTIATYEGLKRPDSVSVLPIMDDKLWLGYQEQPGTRKFWGLFGGRIDKGEKPLTAAKRELSEEAGLTSEDWELTHEHDFSTTKVEWKSYFYIARDCQKVQEPEHEPGERIEIKEMGLDQFVEYCARDDFRDKEIALYVLRLAYQNKLEEFKQKLFK